MENTYRFRFLIYLAAFMLIMSLCFVYAEPLPSRNPLLFQTAPQHAGFLPSLKTQPSFDPADLRAATTSTPLRALWAIDNSRAQHGFFHRSRKTIPSFVLVNVPDETSVVVLTRQPSPSKTR
jgi:hypothetical protein